MAVDNVTEDNFFCAVVIAGLADEVLESSVCSITGRFKSFEGAAFASLGGYEKSTEGHVYIISNPCWDGWVKVGMAVDAEDRCNKYQTSSPFRDYKECYTKYFKDRRSAEQMAHKELKKISVKYKGEWFKVSIKEATNLIQAI